MTEWNPDNPADLRIWDDVIYEVSAFNKSKLARQACTSIVAEAPSLAKQNDGHKPVFLENFPPFAMTAGS